MKAPLSVARDLPAAPLPAAPWRELARLHCLALAVERRAAGDDAVRVATVAEYFYQWVTKELA